MLNLLEQTSSLKLKIISILKECIIFGFPDHIPETKGKNMFKKIFILGNF